MRARAATSILLLALGASGAAAQSGPAPADSPGQEIREQHCAACHAASNIMVASPKLHTKAPWVSRLEAGFDAVLANAVAGINALPAMGASGSCTADEIEAAIRCMAAPALPDAGGSEWKKPSAAFQPLRPGRSIFGTQAEGFMRRQLAGHAWHRQEEGPSACGPGYAPLPALTTSV